MSKKLLNYIMIVLILFGVSLILNTSSAEARVANFSMTTPSTNNAIITSASYTFKIDWDLGSGGEGGHINATNCTWFTSTDDSTWTPFNESVNTTEPYRNQSNITHLNLAEGTYTLNVTCYTLEAGTTVMVDEGILTGIVVDRTAPSVSAITLPKYTNIFVTDGIKIKCGGTDTNIKKTVIKLTKPSGKTIEVNVDGSEETSWTYEFKNKDTNEAGLYKVDCKVTDDVNFTKSASQVTFRAFFADSGGEDTGEAAPVAKLDISTKNMNTGMINGKQGESKTFTMDGTTAHTISFTEVGLTSATFTIKSEPVEVTLNVGEYTNVDLDDDDVDDVKVTLSSIDDGLAKVEVINLEKLEEKREEERKAAEPQVPTVTEEPSKMGLWITILVILVIIGVGYYLLKGKKGKKGQVKFSKQDLGL